MIRAAFFDMDGVLLDSLDVHLEICRDKRAEYGLPIRVPTADEFRAIVRRGAVISPMREFFLAVGFPPQFAERADADYRRDFAQFYPIRPFAGVHGMLDRLVRAHIPLGIVTSNTYEIVGSALGKSMLVFDPRCRFTLDDGRQLNKAQALLAGATQLCIPPSDILYIGDQPKDFEAATAAGCQFLGVTYGWGLCEQDDRFATADSIPMLEHRILEAAG